MILSIPTTSLPLYLEVSQEPPSNMFMSYSIFMCIFNAAHQIKHLKKYEMSDKKPLTLEVL